MKVQYLRLSGTESGGGTSNRGAFTTRPASNAWVSCGNAAGPASVRSKFATLVTTASSRPVQVPGVALATLLPEPDAHPVITRHTQARTTGRCRFGCT